VTGGNIAELAATTFVALLVVLLSVRTIGYKGEQDSGGESVSQSPLMQKLFFHLGTWEPTVLATSHRPIPSVRCAPTLCVISVDMDAAAERAISACGGDARKTTKGLIVANDFLGLRRTGGGCIERLFSRSASAGPQA